MRLVSVCLLYFFISLFIFASSVFAHTSHLIPSASEGQVNEALMRTVPIRFLPSSPLYFLISIKESVRRFFQPSARERANFDLVLSGKRLKETYLLLKKKDINQANKNFLRFAQRLDMMVYQLEKARSQNQDVAILVDEMAEGLKIHETLFFAIQEELGQQPRDHSVDENFDKLIESFTKAVMAINNIKPGVKDRFKTVVQENQMIPSPNPSPPPAEATPTGRPKRIIF